MDLRIKPYRILITDDDPGCREAMRDIFEPEGYPTYLASSGEEAVEIVREVSVHLVLLDMHMPRLSGLETIERLRRHTTASLLALLDETYSRREWLGDCARIRCPALVIAGSADHFPTVAMSERLAATIPGARLAVIEGGGHFPNRTHRSEVQAVIGTFLETIGV